MRNTYKEAIDYIESKYALDEAVRYCRQETIEMCYEAYKRNIFQDQHA